MKYSDYVTLFSNFLILLKSINTLSQRPKSESVVDYAAFPLNGINT